MCEKRTIMNYPTYIKIMVTQLHSKNNGSQVRRVTDILTPREVKKYNY